VKIGGFVEDLQAGFAYGEAGVKVEGIPHLRPMNISSSGDLVWEGTKFIPRSEIADKQAYLLRKGDVLFNNTNSKELVGKTCYIGENVEAVFSNHMTRIRADLSKAEPVYLATLLHDLWRRGHFLTLCNKWVGQAGINVRTLATVEIPLPPMDVQRQIVAELDGYRRVIEGARQVVANYKPTIRIDPSWPIVRLAQVCTSVLSGGTPSTQVAEYWQGNIPWITSADIMGLREVRPRKFITQDAIQDSATNLIPANNVIVVTRVGLGKLLVNGIDLCISQDSQGLIVNRDVIDPGYMGYVLAEKVLRFKEQSRGSTIQGVTKTQLLELEISLPPLDVQRQIVDDLEAERALVDANRKLVEIFEQKSQDKLAEIWGEAGQAA
jgi:restriction endonuclease S subunit